MSPNAFDMYRKSGNKRSGKSYQPYRFATTTENDDQAQKPKRENSRKIYNTKRMEDFREFKGVQHQAEITKGTLERLIPGQRNEMTAMDRIESINTMKAVTMLVTTRSIGFSAIHCFAALYRSLHNVPVGGTIYEFYRVAMAMFDVKVQLTGRGIPMITGGVGRYTPLHHGEDVITTVKSIVIMPEPIVNIINSIGLVKSHEKTYVPRLGADNYTQRGHMFIPQSEQVSLTNLRRVVQSLSDPHMDLRYRVAFYNNNPIPGCRWHGAPANPILVNPDEIMPRGYDRTGLLDDIESIIPKVEFMAKKLPRYFKDTVSYATEGQRTQFVCNEQCGARVSDRNDGETLADYYNRSRPSVTLTPTPLMCSALVLVVIIIITNNKLYFLQMFSFALIF